MPSNGVSTIKLICPVLLIRACKYETEMRNLLSPPAALAQWLAVLVLDGGYRSLPGGKRDGRNPPGEIGVDLPCELAPTSKYPRFDLVIGEQEGRI